MAVPHFNQFRIGIDKRACVNARKIKVSPAGSPGSLRFGAEWLGYFFNRLMHRDLDCSRSLTTIVDWTSAESPVNTSRLSRYLSACPDLDSPRRPNEAIILGSRCRAEVLPSPSRYRLMQ